MCRLLRGSAKPIIAREDSDFSEDEDVSGQPTPLANSHGGDSSHNLPTKLASLEAKNTELVAELQRQKRFCFLFLFFFHSCLFGNICVFGSRADGADKRATAIERKFETFRDKEKRETAALEKMVLDVEENLRLSTSRALAAEANAARLQTELNKALAELQAERLAGRGGGGTTPSDFGPYTADNIADIHSRVNHVSQELKSVTENARNALQMLISNANAIERCSSSLKTLDKITELGVSGGK